MLHIAIREHWGYTGPYATGFESQKITVQSGGYTANNHTEEGSGINKFQWEHAACKQLPEGEGYQRPRFEHEEKQDMEK